MRQIDNWSVIVIAVTLILFVVALFVTGFTHDLLLEAGVFLVSVKLILMSYKNGAQGEELNERLSQIQNAIQRLERSSPPK
jgi:glucose-6-phosphate-specific signal transduction histidine kinase